MNVWSERGVRVVVRQVRLATGSGRSGSFSGPVGLMDGASLPCIPLAP
jgi:hypothetical protein